jgi:hypothetical protein
MNPWIEVSEHAIARYRERVDQSSTYEQARAWCVRACLHGTLMPSKGNAKHMLYEGVHIVVRSPSARTRVVVSVYVESRTQTWCLVEAPDGTQYEVPTGPAFSKGRLMRRANESSAPSDLERSMAPKKPASEGEPASSDEDGEEQR